MTYLLSVLQAQKLVHILSKGGYSQPTREDNGTSNQWAPLMCGSVILPESAGGKQRGC